MTTNLQTIKDFYNLIKNMNGADFYNNIYFSDKMLNVDEIIKFMEETYTNKVTDEDYKDMGYYVGMATDSMAYDYVENFGGVDYADDDLEVLVNLLEFIINPTKEDVKTFNHGLEMVKAEIKENFAEDDYTPESPKEQLEEFTAMRSDETRELLGLFY